MNLIKYIILLCAFPTLAQKTHAAIVVSGDPASGTGVISITSDITIPIIATGDVRTLVFDEWVSDDGVSNFDGILPSEISYILNMNPVAFAGGLGVTDNQSSSVLGAVSSNDGYFYFDIFSVVPGDVLTIGAGTWSMPAIAGFNPSAIGTFRGEVFLGSSFGDRLSDNVAIPEPNAATLVLIGLSLMPALARKRRSHTL
jgi:hypothetical protein